MYASTSVPLLGLVLLASLATSVAAQYTCPSYAARFSASGGYDCGGGGFHDNSEITFEFWLRIPEATPGMPVAGSVTFSGTRPDTSSISQGYGFMFNQDGDLAWLVSQVGVGIDTTLTASIPLNTWTHVAGVLAPSSIALYVNGNQIHRRTGVRPVQFGFYDHMYIGALRLNSRLISFSGDLDEIRLWDYARSASDIRDDYDVSLPINTAGLLGYWQVNDESNPIVLPDVARRFWHWVKDCRASPAPATRIPVCSDCSRPCVPEACLPDCVGSRECGDDGCGGSCGVCPTHHTCNNSGMCQCVPQCSGRDCGDDGCGGRCGTCTGHTHCDAGTGQCECDPHCDARECGSDGCGGSCGTCHDHEVCQDDGSCYCEPQCQGRDCGDDGCHSTCGSCAGHQECTDAGQCIDVCIPDCAGRDCGSDGCGGTCGACADSEQCLDNGTCYCEPQCNGRSCGSDGCGGVCPPGCGADLFCMTNGTCSDVCQPNCDGRVCGDDGCGGDCGVCGQDAPTCVDGLCECVAQCDGRECGTDGCGGVCGPGCRGDQHCSLDGQCISSCIIDCDGRECGPDACGGSCGSCPGSDVCNIATGQCGCVPSCDHAECGSNGCGGVCGTCDDGMVCNDHAHCVDDVSCNPACIPGVQVCRHGVCEDISCAAECIGRQCGADGCGGQCGPGCVDGFACDATSGLCVASGSVDPGPDLILDETRLIDSMELSNRYFGHNSCAEQEGCINGSGVRTVLRFDTATPNIGRRDLQLGRPSSPDYEYDECHLHWHYNGYAKYDILDAQGRPRPGGRKRAYCLLDSAIWDGYDASGPAGPPSPTQRFSCNFQGIQRGWMDVYPKHIDCQWIDVTDLEPGMYTMVVTLNPDFDIPEENYANNIARFSFEIPAECVADAPVLAPPIDPTFAWEDPISNGHREWTSPLDDGSFNIQLPFSFTFYCQSFDRLWVNSNGIASFSQISGPLTARNADSQGLCLQNSICPLWDDWNPELGGRIFRSIEGSPNTGDYRFVVTWYDVKHYGAGPTGDNNVSFQLVLYQQGNRIEFRYLDTGTATALWNHGGAATVGFRGMLPSESVQYSFRQSIITPHLVLDSQNDPPVAVPGGPYTGRVGVPILFDGAASYDPDGELLEFVWNWNDNNPPETTARPSHVYASPGQYYVALFVSDGFHTSEIVTTLVTVYS